MTNYILNIGLNVSKHEVKNSKLTESELNRAIYYQAHNLMFGIDKARDDVNITYLEVATPENCDKVNEPTLVVYLNADVTESHMHEDIVLNLSRILKQDCIALYNEDTQQGVLIGERASEWGTFDGSYFVEKQDIKI